MPFPVYQIDLDSGSDQRDLEFQALVQHVHPDKIGFSKKKNEKKNEQKKTLNQNSPCPTTSPPIKTRPSRFILEQPPLSLLSLRKCAPSQGCGIVLLPLRHLPSFFASGRSSFSKGLSFPSFSLSLPTPVTPYYRELVSPFLKYSSPLPLSILSDTRFLSSLHFRTLTTS